jgi:hypothetical protein
MGAAKFIKFTIEVTTGDRAYVMPPGSLPVDRLFSHRYSLAVVVKRSSSETLNVSMTRNPFVSS